MAPVAGKAKGKAKAKAKATANSPSPLKAASPLRAPAPRPDAEALAKEVLRLGGAGKHVEVLRLLGDPVTAGGGGGSDNGAAARKAFLRISMLIHPDKLRGFPDATKAFQALVHAFDRHQTKVPTAGGELRHKALGRSNDGCYRTQVRCPRCEVAWGSAVEGNPDYYYNFMMQGLRCFTCSTCLLDFGCFTADHSCPFCKRTFEYYPDMYNQKVTCGHSDCRKSFGFLIFHASERSLKEARDQVRADYEKRAAVEACTSGRAARAARRGGSVEVAKVAEACFVEGLQDICPRCGLELEGVEEGDQLRHLRSCTDSAAHKAHQTVTATKTMAAEKAAAKAKAQTSSASTAVWNFTGGHVGMLWMLDEEQLKKRCKAEGLSTNGQQPALVASLREHLLARGEPLGAPAETLPKALHAMSQAQLASVCAAHGVAKADMESREACLEALEDLRLLAASASRQRLGNATSSPAPAIGNGGAAKRKVAGGAAAPLAIQDRTASAEGKAKASAKAKPFSMVRAKVKAKAKAKGATKAKADKKR